MEWLRRARRALADLIDDRPGRDTVLMEIPREYQPIIRKMLWSAQTVDTRPAITAALSEVTAQEWRNAVRLLLAREAGRQAGQCPTR